MMENDSAFYVGMVSHSLTFRQIMGRMLPLVLNMIRATRIHNKKQRHRKWHSSLLCNTTRRRRTYHRDSCTTVDVFVPSDE